YNFRADMHNFTEQQSPKRLMLSANYADSFENNISKYVIFSIRSAQKPFASLAPTTPVGEILFLFL
ncbi:MAG: hypothetical protein ACTSUM_02295, partial [Alphaproteobacteria bacterium]